MFRQTFSYFSLCLLPLFLSLVTTEKSLVPSSSHHPFRYLYTLVRSPQPSLYAKQSLIYQLCIFTFRLFYQGRNDTRCLMRHYLEFTPRKNNRNAAFEYSGLSSITVYLQKELVSFLNDLVHMYHTAPPVRSSGKVHGDDLKVTFLTLLCQE